MSWYGLRKGRQLELTPAILVAFDCKEYSHFNAVAICTLLMQLSILGPESSLAINPHLPLLVQSLKITNYYFKALHFRVIGYAARGDSKTVNIYKTPTTCQTLFQFTDKKTVVQKKVNYFQKQHSL